MSSGLAVPSVVTRQRARASAESPSDGPLGGCGDWQPRVTPEFTGSLSLKPSESAGLYAMRSLISFGHPRAFFESRGPAAAPPDRAGGVTPVVTVTSGRGIVTQLAGQTGRANPALASRGRLLPVTSRPIRSPPADKAVTRDNLPVIRPCICKLVPYKTTYNIVKYVLLLKPWQICEICEMWKYHV